MEEVVGAAIIEGIGNEVLMAILCGTIGIVLSLVWFSTGLTHSQTRLTPVRIQRSNVELNRLPGSSTSDPQTPNQPIPSQSQAAVLQVRAVEMHEELRQDDSNDVQTVTHDTEIVEPTEPVSENEASDDAGGDIESGSESNGEPDTANSVEHSGSSNTLASDTNTQQSEVNGSSEATGTTVEASNAADKATPESPSTTETMEADNSGGERARADPQHSIQIKLKFLTDNERMTRAKPTDTILEFKRSNFAAELSANKLVRLICNGHELQDPKTLQYYNITDNTTIHALINDSANNTNTRPRHADAPMFETGGLMVPLFALILCMIWYLRYDHAELFNVTSTMSLVGITGVFIFCFLAQQRPALAATLNRQRNINVHTQVRGGND